MQSLGALVEPHGWRACRSCACTSALSALLHARVTACIVYCCDLCFVLTFCVHRPMNQTSDRAASSIALFRSLRSTAGKTCPGHGPRVVAGVCTLAVAPGATQPHGWGQCFRAILPPGHNTNGGEKARHDCVLWPRWSGPVQRFSRFSR